jgi:hypothetical protein
MMLHDWTVSRSALEDIGRYIGRTFPGEGWYKDGSSVMLVVSEGTQWRLTSYSVDPRPEMERVLRLREYR